MQKEFIINTALGAGFSTCGVARVRSLNEHLDRLTEWLASGYHSGLTYLATDPAKRTDPALLVPGAKTVLVCAVNYKNEFSNSSNTLPVSSYAVMRNYHITIKEMLYGVLERIRERFPDVTGRCFVDTAPILEKAWAVEAGLGWIGRNSLLVTPRHGSFVFLGEIVLDAEADGYDNPFKGTRCGNCTRCVTACPNGAIRSDRTININLCISRLTTQKNAERDAPLHGMVHGCDICQVCCPHNTKTPLSADPAFIPVLGRSHFEPGRWKNMKEEEFVKTYGDTPLGEGDFRTIRHRLLSDDAT